MDVDVESRVDVAWMLHAAAAALFLLVVFLANPSGRNGVIATAGVYGLVETALAAAVTRTVLPNLARFAMLTLSVLVVSVGILPLLIPNTAAVVIPAALALWLFVASIAAIRNGNGNRIRRLLAGVSLLCAAASLVSIALAPAIELRLLAFAACACALAGEQ